MKDGKNKGKIVFVQNTVEGENKAAIEAIVNEGETLTKALRRVASEHLGNKFAALLDLSALIAFSIQDINISVGNCLEHIYFVAVIDKNQLASIKLALPNRLSFVSSFDRIGTTDDRGVDITVSPSDYFAIQKLHDVKQILKSLI